MNFNAKNLSYGIGYLMFPDSTAKISNREVESNEPAFLRRLRGEHEVRDSSRHERPLARPKKQIREGEQDDEPTYVVEDSQDTLSKAEYEALISTNDDDNQKDNKAPSCTEVSRGIERAEAKRYGVTGEAALGKQQVAGIGCSTKRRLAKIVGDDEEERAATPQDNDSRKKDTKTRAKKGKKMKLSFDEGTET